MYGFGPRGDLERGILFLSKFVVLLSRARHDPINFFGLGMLERGFTVKRSRDAIDLVSLHSRACPSLL
jgi:hypothetical protein